MGKNTYCLAFEFELKVICSFLYALKITFLGYVSIELEMLGIDLRSFDSLIFNTPCLRIIHYGYPSLCVDTNGSLVD